MNGCRNAMGWSSQASLARISKIRSVRSQVAVSRALAVNRSSTVSIIGDPPLSSMLDGKRVTRYSKSLMRASRVAPPLQETGHVSYQVDVYTDEHTQQTRLEDDVRHGLTATPKSLPPKYFYDRTGSMLFERITELPEYYPTRTEITLLERIAPNLTGSFFRGDIVEIGAGSSGKTRLVLDALNGNRRAVCYVPLDVDRLTLEASST